MYPSITLVLDPSEPPRYELNGMIREMEDILIDIYYKDNIVDSSFITTVSYKSGIFNPKTITVRGTWGVRSCFLNSSSDKRQLFNI